MSTPPPPPPAVIGSGKPHTVAIKPGTNLASSAKPRKPDDEAGQDLTARLKATLRRGEEVSQVRRGVREADAPKLAPNAQEIEETPPATQAAGLSNAIRQRIAQLRERNEAVGRELDRLPPAGKRAR
jgi:hypothetical protein